MYNAYLITCGLTTYWPNTVNIRAKPTGVHTKIRKKESGLKLWVAL